jgi:tetratricopeptide (TPR) repeat protein
LKKKKPSKSISTLTKFLPYTFIKKSVLLSQILFFIIKNQNNKQINGGDHNPNSNLFFIPKHSNLNLSKNSPKIERSSLNQSSSLIGIFPSLISIKTMILLSKIYIKLHKFFKAESILLNILQSIPFEKQKNLEDDEYILIEQCRKLLIKIYEKQGKINNSALFYKNIYDEMNNSYKFLEEEAEKLMKKGNLTEAQKLFKEALFQKERILPIIEQLVCIYVKHHKYMEASNYLCLCLELREKLKDPEHYSLADILSAMAQVFKLQNRLEESERTFQKAIKIGEKALQSNDNLMKMFQQQNVEEKLKGLEIRNMEIKNILMIAINNLIELYKLKEKQSEIYLLNKRIIDYLTISITIHCSLLHLWKFRHCSIIN